jgi:hypothetical protein
MNRQEKQFLVYKYLIDKMLKPHGVDFDYIVEHPNIDDLPWFQYYTWTRKDEEKFKEEAIAHIVKTLHMSKKQATISMGWILLNHGLKTI